MADEPMIEDAQAIAAGKLVIRRKIAVVSYGIGRDKLRLYVQTFRHLSEVLDEFENASGSYLVDVGILASLLNSMPDAQTLTQELKEYQGQCMLLKDLNRQLEL